MFGKKKTNDNSDESFSLSIAAENLAMPEIHVTEEGTDEKKELSVLDAIAKRCSIRNFKEKAISDEDIHMILAAGMSGPSSCNTRDWSFVVVRDREMLLKMAAANGEAANPLKGAAMAILVCGDMDKAFEYAKDYWIIDGSIAAQNMILAAKGLGIGSVWLGTWPQKDKVEAQSQLFGLPASQIPHSIIAFGYPAQEPDQTKQTWDESIVHYDRW